MPIRARTTRRKSPGWNKLDLRTRFILAQGFDPRGEISESEIEAGYREYREQIVSAHIADRPGTRPRAWWRWSAPEPRQKLGTRPLRATPTQSRFYHAASDSIQTCRPGDVIGEEPVYESEREYLERLSLLLPGELEGTTA